LKFLLIYRNFLPSDWLPDVFAKLGSFLANPNNVVRNYSACCIDKFLEMRVGQSKVITPQGSGLGALNTPVFSREMISKTLLNML